MKVATKEEISQLDKLAVSLGLTSEILMENASSSVFHFIENEIGFNNKFLVFAGPGNNGGDALAVARKLSSHFAKVTVCLVTNKNKFKDLALKNLEILTNYPIEILEYNGVNRVILHELATSTVIIDGIFGVGLNRPIDGKLKELIMEINNSGKSIIAVDIPSGIDANNGQILSVAVKANYTITFGLPKRGFFSYPGNEYIGKLIVSHISYPPQLTDSENINVQIHYVEPMQQRDRNAHKGSLGKALFIAGSDKYFGAPFFNSLSFIKGGGGVSFLATTESIGKVVLASAKEVVLMPMIESENHTVSAKNIQKLVEFSSNVDIVAIGSGLSIDEDTERLVIETIKNVKKPVIVDGDGLTILSRHLEVLKERNYETILTPHIGEFSRLIMQPRENIEKDRFSYLFEAMKSLNSIIVLKGPNTLIGADGKIYINTSGNPVLATPGSGDILVGLIASQVVRKNNVLDGVILGVYLHGLISDLIQKHYKEGITSSEILENIKVAVKYYEENYEAIKEGFYEGKRNLR